MNKNNPEGNLANPLDDESEVAIDEPAIKGAEESEVEDTEVQKAEDAGSDENGDLTLDQALAKLEEAENVAQNAKDDLLRVQAEMQNLRRRTEQDIEKAHKYGQDRFAIELLAVMDNLERSLEAASHHKDAAAKAIFDGVDLTLKSFVGCFAKFKIEVVDPHGEPFDPQLHQAMSMQDNPEVEPNTVITVMQKGYTLHGRVIRPAMVMVSKGSSPDIGGEA
jgi:molecular chaperone GrpE|tara:strand:+ start:1413 stop:2075 length:663 start_codon:yes stop_codon:yes gene_type:complete